MPERFPAHSWSPSELKQQVQAEREGGAFIVYREAGGEQRIVKLGGAEGRVTIGRDSETDIRLDDDGKVSRLHAELVCLGGDWIVADDGLSRNGSFVNGKRVSGRRRLHDQDTLRFGATKMIFRAPGGKHTRETHVAGDAPTAADVSEAQRRVLLALCRPFKEGRPYAMPATNQQIADEVFLSVDAVKAHLRMLFKTFAVEQLPQNEKRARLIERAIESGVISPREL